MKNLRAFSILAFTVISVFALSYSLTATISIALAIATLSSAIPYLIHRQRTIALQQRLDASWPEAIDSLVSGLQSGMAISEAICSLSKRAPENLKEQFLLIENDLVSGREFSETLISAKKSADSAIADQVFETLILAKEFGGKDTNSALRLLSEFVREDLAVMEEIRTKFGWIRNSAFLATVAPWLLLLLLSSQKSTRDSFSSFAGIQLLALGVLLTGVAYLWMERVGKLPPMERALK